MWNLQIVAICQTMGLKLLSCKPPKCADMVSCLHVLICIHKSYTYVQAFLLLDVKLFKHLNVLRSIVWVTLLKVASWSQVFLQWPFVCGSETSCYLVAGMQLIAESGMSNGDATPMFENGEDEALDNFTALLHRATGDDIQSQLRLQPPQV